MALHYFPGRLVHLGGSKQTGLTTSVHPKHQQTLLCKVRKLSRGLKLTIAQTDSPRRSLPRYSVLFCVILEWKRQDDQDLPSFFQRPFRSPSQAQSENEPQWGKDSVLFSIISSPYRPEKTPRTLCPIMPLSMWDAPTSPFPRGKIHP